MQHRNSVLTNEQIHTDSWIENLPRKEWNKRFIPTAQSCLLGALFLLASMNKFPARKLIKGSLNQA